MNSISLYEKHDTFIHTSISPINKIMYAVMAISVPLILPYRWFVIITIIMSMSLLIEGKSFKKVMSIIGVTSLLLLSIMIIQGLVGRDNKTVLFSIGSVKYYKEGFLYGIKLSLRIINIICALSILIFTVNPSELVEVLVKKGLSPKIGYVMGSVLQIIPQMVSSVGTITDAQRSRGLETKGKISTRIKAFFPLIAPVVTGSLVNTRERSMALEIRGFTSEKKRTFLNNKQYPKYNILLFYIMILLIIFSVVWRIIL